MPTSLRPRRLIKQQKRPTLDRSAWVQAARKILIARGIRAIKVETLAAKLGVTREAFYWHFDALADLHAELLKDWEAGNSVAYQGLLDPAGRDDNTEFRGVGKLWVRENYVPEWDIAVRDWAREAPAVAKAVRRVDKMRVGIIERVFRDMGYNERNAMIRARVTYFNQVGEQRVGLQDSDEDRAKYERELFYFLILGRS